MMAFKPFSPGVALMRRLRLPTKLGALALVMVIPLTVVTFFLTQRLTEDMRIAQDEVHGVEIIDEVSHLIRAVQTHRGRTQMQQAGDGAAGGASIDAHGPVEESVQAIDALFARHSRFDLGGEWGALKPGILALISTEQMRSPGAFAAHTAVIQNLRQLLYTAAERSSLLFDPVPATYFLMDQHVSQTVAWAELVGQVRGLGAGALSATDFDAALAERIHGLISTARTRSHDMGYLQRFLKQYGQADLQGQTSVETVLAFLDQADKALTQPGVMSSEAYFAQGTAALAAVDSYESAVAERLHNLLETRLSESGQMRSFTVAAAFAGLLLLCYLLASFFLSFVIDFRQVMGVMRETALGNLRSNVRIRGTDELAELGGMLISMNNNLSVMVAEVRSNSALVAHSGMSLAAGNQDLADRTEQQAASLEQTVASVQELSGTVRQNADTAGDSDAQASRVREVADLGARAMNEAIESVEVIQRGAQQMNEIIGVIDSIAFQTNILALNAAVEAARAGEQGRGFAVVASEVRTLAQRSAASSREIRTLIEASSHQVAGSVQRIRLAGDNMAKIVEGVRGVASNMSLISAASADQSSGLTEISAAVGLLDEITQRNAQMVERAVGQANLLASRAGELSQAVAAFSLQQGTAEEAMALVKRALGVRNTVGADGFAQALTDPTQGFYDRDMYVFALDQAGAYRSFGGKPEKVGSRVQDIAGVDGQALLRAIVEQAEVGAGWVEYEINNPITGSIQTKMSYVQKIDNLYVGCGVYKSAVLQAA